MAAYDAFVSYSHAKDKPVAAALQSVIQRLGKPWYKRRALRLFRDDTSLSATPGLWPSIEQALANSRYFLLFASPQAAASPWVNKEVSYWLEHKMADTLLIAVTEGTLVWDNTLGDFARGEGTALPPALAGCFVTEPKWVDLTGFREGAHARNAKFIEAGADFAAAIHGVPKEDLLSQEVRQQRRALTLAWSSAGTLAVLIALAGWQWLEAEGAKRAAQRERDRAVTAEQVAQTQRERAERNFRVAREAADDVVLKLARDLRDVRGMRVQSVRKILDSAATLMVKLAETDPHDRWLQRSRGNMLSQFVLTYLEAGDLTRASTAAEESLKIFRELHAADPDDSRLRDVAQGLDDVGEVRLEARDTAGALMVFAEALEIRRKLAASFPRNDLLQRDIYVTLHRIGKVRFASGDLPHALTIYGEGLAIVRRLSAANPQNSELLYDVSLSLGGVGDVRRAMADLTGALVAFEEALTIRRKLAAAEADNGRWQHQLALALGAAGEVQGELGNQAGALAAFEERVTIMRTLSAADPSNARWQRDLSHILQVIANARRDMNDHSGALAASEESLGIIRRLIAAAPTDFALRNELSTRFGTLGEVRHAAGDRHGARKAYEEAVEIMRWLVTADPKSSAWQRGLVSRLYWLSTAADPAAARAALREAIAIAEMLARDNKLPAAEQRWPQILREELAKLPPETADAHNN
jgi:tetratricopeptide (TPR) repeat protein